MRQLIHRGGVLTAALLLLAITRSLSAEVTFVFTFFDVTTSTGRGFDDPVLGAERRAALEAVGAEIGARIGQTATIEVGVAPSETDGTGPIGIGAATPVSVVNLSMIGCVLG